MLSTSGNPLNSNTSNNANNAANPNKSNLLSASTLMSSDFMLPINNLPSGLNLSSSSSSNPMASSYLNDYKLYREVGGLFPPPSPGQQPLPKQPSNLTALANSTSLNNPVVNSLGSLNLSNHNNSLNSLNSLTGLNGLPNHNQLNSLSSLNSLNSLNGLNSLNSLNSLSSLQQQQQSSKQQQQQQMINSNPEFVRLISNCDRYLRLSMFQQALEEADQALSLVANSTVAHFRKSQALLGLKRFYEVEKELWACISLEPTVLEYRDELLKVKQMALMSLNLSLDANQIYTFAQKYESIKEAVDAITWNTPVDYNYSGGPATGGHPFQPEASAFHSASLSNASVTNNLSETAGLMNGWSMPHHPANPTTTTQPPVGNRFGATPMPGQFNQLMNGNSLIFNQSLMPGNLLPLNGGGLIAGRSNSNGSNSLSPANSLTSGAAVQPPGTVTGLTSAVVGMKGPAASPGTSNNNNSLNNLNNNLINSSSGGGGGGGSNPAQTNHSPLTSNTLTDQPSLLTNGLSNGSRFNFLLRDLDQTHLLGGAAQLTASNGGNISANSSNQNLINNQQQQLFNRIMPSFIENGGSPVEQPSKSGHTSITSSASAAANNPAVLSCSRSLSSKLTLNDNSLLNSNGGLLIMNNSLNSNLSSNLNHNLSNNLTDSAPSPICAKLSSGAPNNPSASNNGSNLSNSTGSLTNSCNYNIFNQMPEMKLIETIVPSLLSAGASGPTSPLTGGNQSSNRISSDRTTASPTTVSLEPVADLTGGNHKLLASLAEEVNNNHVKESLVSNLVVDNFTSNVQRQQQQKQQQLQQSTKQQEASIFDDCSKHTNPKRIGKLDLLNELTAATDKVIGQLIGAQQNGSSIVDSFKSTSSLTEDTLGIIGSFNQQQNNPFKTNSFLGDHDPAIGSPVLGLSAGHNVSTPPATTPNHQLTSYSDIVKRAKKISTSVGSSNGFGRAHPTERSDEDNSKRPTNLWAYNGLRVANVSTSASKQSLMNLFSRFGRVRLLERIVNKTTANNIWVYYDNPAAPVDAVTKLQSVCVEGICVDSETPLRLFFAPTDDQKDLKFSRPKQPPDNKGNGQLHPTFAPAKYILSVL